MEIQKLPVKRHLPVTKGHGCVKNKCRRNLDEMSIQQFSDSSSQSEGDGEEDSNDADDEEYQQPEWTGRKRPPLVYLELGDKIIIVRNEPQPNVKLEDDVQLKTKMHKFLGLIPSRRKLYNPAVVYDMKPEDIENINCVVNSSHASAEPFTPSAEQPIRPKTMMTSTWSKLNLSNIDEPTPEESQAKSKNDFELWSIAFSFDQCTPDLHKEPIDLIDLPNEEQLAANCRRHKSSVPCLERHPKFYGFVRSLSPSISLNMCHPLALTYRQNNFKICKVALAKVLFNIFNHAIFHCGLQVPIVWKHAMHTRCTCQLTVDAHGKRRAKILLLRSIKTTAELIRCLLHEMCHVAAFVFNRELGHGDNCRRWAYQAKMALPEAPTIEDNCIDSFKYTCTMCTRCSYGVADLSMQNLRCYYCQFEVSVKNVWKSEMYDWTRSDPTMTPFKCFIWDRYLQLGEQGANTHSTNMALLNEEFMRLNSTMD
uniref:SprT-like domain-containing protein n=2 Tax=Drosophila melanogaster TaxID=7227 RepID=Q9VM89_DROME|nr:uncharacterized protein Dmel_CG11322 [Drosophila melanogaster]AAF52434.3 uncharacterized protein Dmel_CG11322 [Drosophila melanogaster]|eukprot:NP_609071.2 uncharacterized protein Dmel_CG11322 [Drosophila melanogaster]